LNTPPRAFKPYDALFQGEIFTKGLPEIHIYNEALAKSRNSLTGQRFSGTPAWVAPADASDRVMDTLENEYPYSVVTYKNRLHTQSRSLWSTYAMEIESHNQVEINTRDCQSMGLAAGETVRLTSASNTHGITCQVKPTGLVRHGCVAISFHFGHSQFGGSPLTVKSGETVFLGGHAVIKDDGGLIVDEKLRAGLNFNDVALLDERLGKTPMVDLVGGIPDFSSTRVKIVKI
jgi:tetrathionate reductase subunit A